MNVIEFGLDVNEIDDAINQLKKYRDSEIDEKMDELLKKLADQGKEIAVSITSSADDLDYDNFPGTIYAKEHESEAHSYVVGSDDSQAAYIEFGTGDRGAESGYVGDKPGWVLPYNSGKQIKTKKDGSHYWRFKRKDTGEWASTHGQSAKAFLYYASLGIKQSVVKFAKEVFEA